MTNAPIYDAAKARITALVSGADPLTPVPATPGWSVKDVVAHLAGGLRDFADGRFDGVESGEWGERQVRDRRDNTLQDAFAEWDENLVRAAELFDTPMGPVLVSEVVAHEHDLRSALGVPGDRGGVEVRAALVRPLQQLDRRLRENDVPALRISLEHGDRVLGHGEPAGTLRTTSFELLRAIGGRRSADQIKALDWDGDPDVWISSLALSGRHRAEPFEE
ncbi:maleylpyruvate isomerase family mycothiol-dependent enzyme [Lentzea sp. CC55]|uniref:maleylpyruvate isomerase family mycothiol-dependent enzyme n=1 Tax=Lentzea sp. CC55 TaxID=2884909 RepID=UPI001F1A1047|nr:maleylpyruvate isomerase family mycothiol-dependent enzyme [Lentzea sp. CC55]MCG8921996.1 maleylpyruvate isomerase family mycothiol-dependent enzyme [Lentzea sp. CC55]